MTVEDEMRLASERLKAVTDEIESWKRDQYAKAGLRETADGTWREPSKAREIGGYRGHPDREEPSYKPGSFLKAVMLARSPDAVEQGDGKASLDAFGTRYLDEQDVRALGSKATLGTTDATGGWLIPGAVIDNITTAKSAASIYPRLMTPRTGVRSFAVDMPLRSAAPDRAVIAAFGATKENVNLAYNGYTATMYTLARIYDIGNQFLRQSQGAAEADVLQALGQAFALGENYYIREGSGSSEPYGIVPALTNGPSLFRTSHTPSASTLAGSVAAAIAKASGALLKRGRRPEAAVMSVDGYIEMLQNGDPTGAGFFLSGINGAQAIPGFNNGTPISPFGVPVVCDPDFAGDDLIVAEWSAFKPYFGDGYRVDSSSEAGTRWDTNLTGFRGEEELGFDARPGVYAGAAQYVTDILS